MINHYKKLKFRIRYYLTLLVTILIVLPFIGISILYLKPGSSVTSDPKHFTLLLSPGTVAIAGLLPVRLLLKEINQAMNMMRCSPA